MTDINFSRSSGEPDSKGAEGAAASPRTGELRWDIIELLFFAYRDFVGDADHELEAFGFGRAHHRVMHFVHRYPGLKVADLLDVLRITKQSLGRVLKQLLDEGYIIQKTGNNDRRQREAARPSLLPVDPRRHDARRNRLRSGALHSHFVLGADHHADGAPRGRGPDRGPSNWRRRLRGQTVRTARAGAADRQYSQAH